MLSDRSFRCTELVDHWMVVPELSQMLLTGCRISTILCDRSKICCPTFYTISSQTMIRIFMLKDGVSWSITRWRATSHSRLLSPPWLWGRGVFKFNWPSRPRTDVVELDDDGNAAIAPTAALDLVAPGHSDGIVLGSSSPFGRMWESEPRR